MPASLLVNVLRVFWAVLILWFELAAFPHQVSQCRWPDLPHDAQTDRVCAFHLHLHASSSTDLIDV